MFKYSCYIENSQEAREWLELIGIRLIGGTYGNMLMVVDGKAMCFELEGNIGQNFQDATDCRGNLPLFKALTALRDDSDYMQWFIHDLCFFDESLEDRMVLCEKEDHRYLNVYTHFKKATKEELIEKFKEEE